MIVSRSDATTLLVDVNFVVVAPAGNEMLVVAQESPSSEPRRACCIVDRAGRMVYGDEGYWIHFRAQARSSHPADDPTLGLGWKTTLRVEGRSLGGVTSTRGAGDSNHAWTRLYVQVADAQGYR